MNSQIALSGRRCPISLEDRAGSFFGVYQGLIPPLTYLTYVSYLLLVNSEKRQCGCIGAVCATEFQRQTRQIGQIGQRLVSV